LTFRFIVDYPNLRHYTGFSWLVGTMYICNSFLLITCHQAV